jgi:hypothetical protein
LDNGAIQSSRKQYIITNNVSHIDSIQDGPTKNFVLNPYESQQVRDFSILQRSTMKSGIYVQKGFENKHMFDKENYYVGLKNYGDLTNDTKLRAAGGKLFEIHREALNEIDPHAIN